MAGYSGTPLAKKLGVRDGQRTWRDGMPEAVAAEIPAPGAVPRLLETVEPGLEMAHLFVTRRAALDAALARVLPCLDPAGMIWVSWPKKAAKLDTDVTEDTVRDAALPLGPVDVKVCPVDAVWSGLKLVIRKERRG